MGKFMLMSEIKNCPFCNGRAYVHERTMRVCIRCEDCKCQTAFHEYSHDEKNTVIQNNHNLETVVVASIQDWNTRHK